MKAYVRADNGPALEFYRKLGFRVVGTAEKQARCGGAHIRADRHTDKIVANPERIAALARREGNLLAASVVGWAFLPVETATRMSARLEKATANPCPLLSHIPRLHGNCPKPPAIQNPGA